MKNEIKTLKDMTGMIGMLPLKSDILDINVVKQEAIKWVKEDLKLINLDVPELDKALIILNNWIKIFNITEEYLKKGEEK